MDADDASFAEMRRPFTDPDPLALDEETVERLLAGDLPPSQAPPGYAQVAALLAATAAPPTPEELAGQAEVLAELRAVTRTRRAGAHARRAGAHTRRAARPPRRRWAGLAAAALVGALVTGGAAAAATGNLPGPVRNVARSLLGNGGGAEPVTLTSPAPAPGSRASTTGAGGAAQTTRSTGTTGRGPASTGAAAAPSPNLEGLCQAYLSSKGTERGKKLDSAAFQALVRAAGSKEQVPGYCQTLLPEAKDKEKEQPAPPDDPGQGQGQGGPPPSNGGGDNRQGSRADERS
jgi:hypothetical protein